MSKEDLNEHGSVPVLPFLALALAALFAGVCLWLLNEGPRRGWLADTALVVLIALAAWLACMLMAVLFERTIREWAANSRIARAFDKQRLQGQRAMKATDEQCLSAFSGSHLRDILQNRHGLLWRYRDQWVMVSGDESLIQRLAPNLAKTGYAVMGRTVLLHAREVGDKPDTAWLDQIRRLRRRRPVDAIVGVVQTQTTGKHAFAAEYTAQRLAQHARALRWAPPAYLLNATSFEGEMPATEEVIGCTWSNGRNHQEEVNNSLRALSDILADAGVLRLTKAPTDRYAAELSQHISNYASGMSELVAQIGQSRIWRSAIHGVLFMPLLKERFATASEATTGRSNAANGETVIAAQAYPRKQDISHGIWQTIAMHSRTIHGRRVGVSASTATAWLVAAAVAAWLSGTMLSGFTNRATIRNAAATVASLEDTANQSNDPGHAAFNLAALQNQLDTLEVRQHDGAPWYTRFGLNHDNELLAVLWPAYEATSTRILVQPVRRKLEGALQQLASLSDSEIASGGESQVKSAYATLKTYLMLAQPAHADAAFLTPQLLATDAPAQPANASLTYGTWQDLRQRLIGFYADHLHRRAASGDRSLAITPDAGLVAVTRQTLVGVIGLQNSTDVVYQQILDENRSKYPPVSLATLLGDTSSRGLFNTTLSVPGIFTRAAWDERIAKAIDEASEHRSVAGDWVLSDTKAGATPPASLKDELKKRYFADYALAWQQFLNSVRWQPDATLSGTVDQLTLLADPQRSPLAALMNVVVYQAGTGAAAQSLSDSLISKAQQLVGTDNKDPSKVVQPQNAAPLAAAFGPLLRLTGSDLAASGNLAAKGRAAAQITSTGDLSVPRYMERVTAMRLKLQQIMMSSDSNAVSRTAAQAVLQGKPSDIADSRDYASRLSASLGEQWAGFGDLLQQPIEQTWRVVLQPAASSLNETWRAGIVADWNRTFGGRYPFTNSDNDASLPEMARFMRPESGLIAQFVTTQLAGVVERQGERWVPAQGTGAGDNQGVLALNPDFLAALNRLTRVSTVLFPSGDARVRYELRAVPTPGITDMRFVLSGRELHYFNQKEEWTPFEWPGDTLENNTRIEWQSEQGGLRSALDSQGRFSLIRLLERAAVAQQDSARYLLTWMPDAKEVPRSEGSAAAPWEYFDEGVPLGVKPDAQTHGNTPPPAKDQPATRATQPALTAGLGLPLRAQLRSEAGAGPLDVLALRHFALPTRIFVTGTVKGARPSTQSGPPPLPLAAIAAAKHAAMPLPQGTPPEAE